LNGRDVYLGRHGSPESKSKYRSLLAEWEQQGRQHGFANHKGPAIDELILAYLEHAAGYYVKDGRPTSEQITLKAALRPLHDLYGRMPSAEFSPTKLMAVRHAMVTDLGWCRTHTNKQVSRIKSMFRWAVEHELIDASVHHALLAVRGLRKGRSEAREPDPITPVAEPHVEEILPHVSRQVAAMVRLQLLTGMRPGEVVIMRGCDLDTSEKVWTYTPESHKTEHHGKTRVIYLGPQAQAIVKPFLQKELSAYLFNPADAEAERNRERRANRKTPMTPSHRRRKPRYKPLRSPQQRYTRDSYRRAIARGCDKAFPAPKKLTTEQAKTWRKEHRWHPNQLRHTAATKLRKEFGIEAARVVLGHSSAAVTEVYAELDLMKAADVMGKIG
jgi:integrase